MNSSEVKRFAELYERHLKLLKLVGTSDRTISCYPVLFAGSKTTTTAVLTN